MYIYILCIYMIWEEKKMKKERITYQFISSFLTNIFFFWTDLAEPGKARRKDWISISLFFDKRGQELQTSWTSQKQQGQDGAWSFGKQPTGCPARWSFTLLQIPKS